MLHSSPLSALADTEQAAFQPYLTFTNLLRGDDLMLVRQQIFMGLDENAQELLR